MARSNRHLFQIFGSSQNRINAYRSCFTKSCTPIVTHIRKCVFRDNDLKFVDFSSFLHEFHQIEQCIANSTIVFQNCSRHPTPTGCQCVRDCIKRVSENKATYRLRRFMQLNSSRAKSNSLVLVPFFRFPVVETVFGWPITCMSNSWVNSANKCIVRLVYVSSSCDWSTIAGNGTRKLIAHN